MHAYAIVTASAESWKGTPATVSVQLQTTHECYLHPAALIDAGMHAIVN